jgi:hypothetical protein
MWKSFRRQSSLFVFASTLPIWGQGFHAGLKLGVPFTQYFETGTTANLHLGATYSSATRRYTFGASGEWRLTNAFGFEVDALYHRVGYTGNVFVFSGVGPYILSVFDVKGSSWDFPIIAKYRFGHVVRPYVAGGGVLRHFGPVREQGEETRGDLAAPPPIKLSTSPIDTTSPFDLNKRFYPGLTVVTGIEIGRGRLRVLPEFRYTRWTANITNAGGLLRLAPNQAELMVGLLF